ncbi:DNA topoisomerase IB [Sulfitobacter sp. S223]|uniref:DNA topoisomerase IB n=1 Tax=Sulfitobacter sp. S223 TaxID=2867023 RepID=UPI0021A2F69C|nr:DNA topoisomerase IB [Sulfitobacter sp. S223]UWR25894.1 DNA topoisomerase IB [Sulfitobacter sp. S223]
MNVDLVYVRDDQPGIRRQRRGRGFSYVAPDGTTIARGAERARLEALAVPPAYEDVWMCALPNGHLQATGRDARARKQYRYHEKWAEAQARTKFDSLTGFAHNLPRLRARVARDLEQEAGERDFALACAVTLIDRTSLRVGHPEYTDQNGSYGALTLRRRHVTLSDDGIALRYVAKGGKKVRRQVKDRTLSRVLHKIGDLPGAEVLTWLDDDGTPHMLSSQALNAYIAEGADEEGITAKTFRTWAGTVAAFEIGEKGSATIKDMAEAAAARLANTPTVARNSYIHPDVVELAGTEALSGFDAGRSGLRAAENRLLAYLER